MLRPTLSIPARSAIATRRYAARPPPQERLVEPPPPPRPNSQAPPQHVYGPSSEAPFEPHNQPIGGPGAALPRNPDTRSRRRSAQRERLTAALVMVGLLAAAFGVAYFVPWERGV
jgi:hypothetical protein